jgi:predicted ATP-dependent serine protease
MVGRDAELAELAAAWERVAEGGSETVLVAGEPGAGKSRLVAEAAGSAHAEGGLVLHGCGPSTLALIRHLARAGSGAPFLLVVTYRPGTTP